MSSDKNIDLNREVSNLELKVIKNKDNMENTNFFDSLNAVHEKENKTKDIDIGLDLLVNQQKNRHKSNSRSSNEDINIVKSNSKEEFIMDALAEENINIRDREESYKANNDVLSFRSYSSGKMKKEKKFHTFSIEEDINRQEPQLFSHEELDRISEDIIPNDTTNHPDNTYNHIKHATSNKYKDKTNYHDLRKEKEELLYKFEKLRRLGTSLPKSYNMTSDINEMRSVYERIRKSREMSNGVKFSRKMLVACTTAIEFLNTKFDPLDVKLDGWSESIHENINDYDEVFEELYEKYQTDTKIAPELKLIFMVAGSGFMFHLTNTMFKSSLPGMGDILKQNPNLMKQFASAAMNTMNNNAKESSDDLDNIPMPSVSGGQRNMRGPSGIEDILNELSSENGDSHVSINNEQRKTLSLNLG